VAVLQDLHPSPIVSTKSQKRIYFARAIQPTKEPSMTSNKRFVTRARFTTMVFSLLSLVAAAPCRAQAPSSPRPDDANLPGTSGQNPAVARDTVAIDQPTAADPAASGPPQAAATAADDAWHFALSPYLWLPGVHGTASGPSGQGGLDFRASPSDLISHFRFGLLGAVDVRHKRFVTSGDLLWLRLGDDRAIANRILVRKGATTANMTADILLLTPKVGIRVINEEKIKIDALTGFRYWHFGESLHINPPALGLNFSGSQNFVDPLVGGRIQMALWPKIGVNILGDVGGWGTGSQLEYQVAGFLSYRIKPAWTLQAGYRYLNMDYNTTSGGVFNITIAGVLLGVTWNLK